MQINLSQKTLQFRTPLLTPDGEQSQHYYVGIFMMDDKGQRIGLGECAPLPWASADKDAYNRLSDVATLINDAMDSNDYAENLRPYPALLFALESAMYDYQQNPLLYDTPFAKSQVGIPLVGNITAVTYDDMLRSAKQMMLQGFRCIKLHITNDNIDDVINVIGKIRSRFSPSALQIRLDGGAFMTPQEARDIITTLAPHLIHSIERPLAQHHRHALASLCQDTKIPVTLSSELTGINTLKEKSQLLDTLKPQYLSIKPMLHGGMAGTIEWVSEAQKRGIASWLSSAYEGNIGQRNIALLAARIYGATPLPQDIDTGNLYSDNIEMDMELRHNKLWRCLVEN